MRFDRTEEGHGPRAGRALVACCDKDPAAVEKFAHDFSCTPFPDHPSLLAGAESDIVIVSVVNKFARACVIDGLRSGRHVLVEKPLGRNAAEARDMVECLSEVCGPLR